MALKLTVILILVMFVAMRFGGRDVANGPFVEHPGMTPETALLSVRPLDEPLSAPGRVDPAFASAFASDAPRPEPEPTPEPDAEPQPVTARIDSAAAAGDDAALDADTARSALDLAVIDATGSRDRLGGAAPVLTAPVTTRETAEPVQTAPSSAAEVTGTRVNLRAGPSTGNPVIGQAVAGDRVEWVSEAAPGWALIRHPDIDGDAYMSSNYLRRIAN